MTESAPQWLNELIAEIRERFPDTMDDEWLANRASVTHLGFGKPADFAQYPDLETILTAWTRHAEPLGPLDFELAYYNYLRDGDEAGSTVIVCQMVPTVLKIAHDMVRKRRRNPNTAWAGATQWDWASRCFCEGIFAVVNTLDFLRNVRESAIRYFGELPRDWTDEAEPSLVPLLSILEPADDLDSCETDYWHIRAILGKSAATAIDRYLDSYTSRPVGDDGKRKRVFPEQAGKNTDGGKLRRGGGFVESLDPAKVAEHREMMASFSPEEEEVFRLKYLDGMSYRAIAKQVGKDEKQIQRLLNRKLAYLQEKFSD